MNRRHARGTSDSWALWTCNSPANTRDSVPAITAWRHDSLAAKVCLWVLFSCIQRPIGANSRKVLTEQFQVSQDGFSGPSCTWVGCFFFFFAWSECARLIPYGCK